MKKWVLFIDDVRVPDENTVLARSVPEALHLIRDNGFPSRISFDHDLGDNTETGYDFLNLIIEKVLDKEWQIPNDFSFEVHSDNPVGSENIRLKFNNFLKHQGIPFQLIKAKPHSSRRISN